MRLYVFLSSVGVLSCEVALPFSPCLPGSSPRAYRLQLWPRPLADLGPNTQGSGKWGWGHVGPSCHGVCCLWASGRGRPLHADTGFQRPFSALLPGRPLPAAPWGAGHPLGFSAWCFITPGPRQRLLSGRTGWGLGGAQGVFQFLPCPRSSCCWLSRCRNENVESGPRC